MQEFATQTAIVAIDKETGNSEQAIATFMKSTFENKYKGVWHCIVGRNFGGFVTHEQKKYIYFYIG